MAKEPNKIFKLEDLGDVDIAQVFSSKCGPSAMSTSPRSSSSSRYHEVNRKKSQEIFKRQSVSIEIDVPVTIKKYGIIMVWLF